MGTSRGCGVASGGLAPILADSRMEVESTGTIIVDLGSLPGPPPEILQIGSPVGCLGEGSGVLLITLGPDDVGVPATLAGRGLTPSPPKSPAPESNSHMHSVSSDARGDGSPSSMCDLTPAPVGRIGTGRPAVESRRETTASDSDIPQNSIRVHEVAFTGAGGELHPSMCDCTSEPYKTGGPRSQSLDGLPSGSENLPSSRVVESMCTIHPPDARGDYQHQKYCDLAPGHGFTCAPDSRTQGARSSSDSDKTSNDIPYGMHVGSSETPTSGSHLPVDSISEPESRLDIGVPWDESRGETPGTASGGTYTSSPDSSGCHLHPIKDDLVPNPTFVGVSDSRSPGVDVSTDSGKPSPSPQSVREGQPDEPCGVLPPSMRDCTSEPINKGVPWSQSRVGGLAADSGQPHPIKNNTFNNPGTFLREECSVDGSVAAGENRHLSAFNRADCREENARSATCPGVGPTEPSYQDGRGDGGTILGGGVPRARSRRRPEDTESPLVPSSLFPASLGAARSLEHTVDELLAILFSDPDESYLPVLDVSCEDFGNELDSR